MGNLLKAGKTALDFLLEEEVSASQLPEGVELVEEPQNQMIEMLRRWREVLMRILEALFDDGEEVREMFRVQENERMRRGALHRASTAFLKDQFAMTSQESFPLSDIVVRLGEVLGRDGQLSADLQQMLWEMAHQLQEHGKVVLLTPSEQLVLFDQACDQGYLSGLRIVPAEGVTLDNLAQELPGLLMKNNPYMGRSGMIKTMQTFFPEHSESQGDLLGQQVAEMAQFLLSIFPGMGTDEDLRMSLQQKMSAKKGVAALIVAFSLYGVWQYEILGSPAKFAKVYEQLKSGEKTVEDFLPSNKK